MKKIVLLCASGMSTSMLVKKMQAAAQAQNLDCSIAAYSASEAATKAADADVVLLGPQIRFSKDKIAAQVPGVPACMAAWMVKACSHSRSHSWRADHGR